MRQLAFAIIALSVVAVRAEAQSVAIAEQLFNEARELGKAGRWQEACPKFLASLQHDPALGTRLNLATCYERIGKLAMAWGLYREAVAIAQRANDGKRAEYARKQAAALEPRLPKLVITGPAQPAPGFAVQRDGTVVDAAELGLALYVDPGPHEVTASAPGFLSFKQTVTLKEGAVETLAIPTLEPEPVAKEESIRPEVPAETAEPTAESVSSTRTYVGLTIGGVGIVAVGAGLVFGSQAISANNQAKELCGEQLACSAADLGQGQRYIDDGRAKATLSTAFVIGGGAAIIAGAVVYLTSRGSKESARTARRAPLVPVIRGASIGLAGSF